MIKIVAKRIVKDGENENLVNTARELIEKSRLEDGCISYCLCAEFGTTNGYAIIEEWESREKVEAHAKTEHYLRIIPQLNALSVAPSAIT
ncbi:MAG: antibiotic biosynthesis monooxygenase, partial [Clostridiales Family XIII bacterium]|nr:antibiotic biosynthesis monooxygenase [Clostridiales Family XIII bacterium]